MAVPQKSTYPRRGCFKFSNRHDRPDGRPSIAGLTTAGREESRRLQRDRGEAARGRVCAASLEEIKKRTRFFTTNPTDDQTFSHRVLTSSPETGEDGSSRTIRLPGLVGCSGAALGRPLEVARGAAIAICCHAHRR